jgi:hypothetical protein
MITLNKKNLKHSNEAKNTQSIAEYNTKECHYVGYTKTCDSARNTEITIIAV